MADLMGRPARAGIRENPAADQYMWIAVWCGAIIAALYIVELVSGTEFRHFVQTLPLWLGVVFGIRRVRVVRWLVLPMFLFWLGIMVLIWLFLLGWAHVVSGHFSPVEILMTFVVGIASLLGIVGCFRGARVSELTAPVVAFVIGSVLQLAAFQVSFLPGIAR